MIHVHRLLLGLSILAGVSACGSSGCDEAADCPEITCDDGSTLQACLFGACATECEGTGAAPLTEADAGE